MRNSRRRFSISNVLKLLLGVVILSLVVASLDLKSLLAAISQVKMEFLAVAILAYVCLDLVLSYRLFKCLNTIGHRITWRETFWVHLFGMLLSNVTPGRVGYVGLSYLLYKRRKLPISESISCLGTIEAIELMVKAGLAAAGLAFITMISGNQLLFQFGLLGIIAIFFMSSIFLTLCWKEFEILDRIVRSTPFVGRELMQLIISFRGASRKLRKEIKFIAAFSILGWIVRGVEWSFIGWACNINLPFYFFFLLHPLLTSIRYLPITPAGLGIFEGITLLGFSIFGVPRENALLLSLFDRIDNMLVDWIALKEMRHL